MNNISDRLLQLQQHVSIWSHVMIDECSRQKIDRKCADALNPLI